MKLLLNTRNELQAIGKDIQFGVWGNIKDLPSWKIDSNYYMMDGGYEIVEVPDDDIPDYVTPGWMYKNNTFYKRPDAPPTETEEKISELENAICELSTLM